MVSGVLAMGRAAVRSRMRATCVIEVMGMTTDPATGREVHAPIRQVYPNPDWPDNHADKSGPCYTRYPGLAHPSEVAVAGSSVTKTKLVVRIPMGVQIDPNMRVTIISDPDNPRMNGTRFTVSSVDDMSQATAQRILCDDYQWGVAT